ncbi:MAG: AmmeMemoRadiSam system protein B [Chlorobi bacterium]|nr:AmmeMemoRadiSam system protein B [Chlorobiota bacterium]
MTYLLMVLSVWLFIPACNACTSAEKGSPQKLKNRSPVVAGTFYPANAAALRKTLTDFFTEAPVVQPDGEIIALISPHAGYIYAGKVAAAGYRQLDRDANYDHIFLIGPSHYVGFPGASVYNIGNYETPLGEVEVDRTLANRLIRENDCFVFDERAHAREHCLEVQLPYLQYWLKNPFKLVPVVIGTQDPAIIKKIAAGLKPYFHSGNLFVISSDMSHYPEYNDAEVADTRTLDAIVKNDPDDFLKTLRINASKGYRNLVTSMCGSAAVLVLLEETQGRNDIHYQKVMYRNSGDIPEGDKSRVVGYGSVMVTKTNTMGQDYLTKKDKLVLLHLARKVLNDRIVHGQVPALDHHKYSETLQKPAGAFVTLTENGRLRGCIGRFQPDQPLYEVVKDMTISAALNDPRFSPVKPDEVDNIGIEISVLTPLKKINSADEFILGKQGIYMVRDGRSGTFLPQVANSTGWTKEEFLGHCARDKAGIGWDGWKDADLYTYEAVIFSEKEFGLQK